ncbi:hypothetical protein J6590_083952 [Homalodisca vitripennis]|nr:hypothetical protein J6590_083952 [Homalodisca vitripennis]
MKHRRPEQHSSITGKAIGGHNLTVTDRLKFLFISRLSIETKCEDLKSFLTERKSGKYFVEKLNSRFPNYYSSFKIARLLLFQLQAYEGKSCLDNVVSGLPRDSLSVDVLQPPLSDHSALITTMTSQSSIEHNLSGIPVEEEKSKGPHTPASLAREPGSTRLEMDQIRQCMDNKEPSRVKFRRAEPDPPLLAVRLGSSISSPVYGALRIGLVPPPSKNLFIPFSLL